MRQGRRGSHHLTMFTDPVKIFLVGAGPEEAHLLAGSLALIEPAGAFQVVHAAVSADSADHVEDADVAIINLPDEPVENAARTVDELSERLPGVPIIAVTATDDMAFGTLMVQAGAHDYIARQDVATALMRRIIRNAAARGQWQRRLLESGGRGTSNSDLYELRAIEASASLEVTERSLGTGRLQIRAADEFQRLLESYGDLLDRSLLHHAKRLDDARLAEELNRLADRLGLLGAGPRDVVDLHKAALSAKLVGQTPQRARALVDEGRMLLLRTMGYVLSFYRGLSWGSDPRVTLRRASTATQRGVVPEDRSHEG